jgi:cobalamin synthase
VIGILKGVLIAFVLRTREPLMAKNSFIGVMPTSKIGVHSSCAHIDGVDDTSDTTVSTEKKLCSTSL